MAIRDVPKGRGPSGGTAPAVGPAAPAMEPLEPRVLLATTGLYADFDLEYVYAAPEGAASFAASTQTVQPAWSLALENTQPVGFEWQIDRVTFDAPYALSDFTPPIDAAAGFQYSWDDLRIGPGQACELAALEQGQLADAYVPLSVRRSFTGNEITGAGDLTTTVMVIPEAGLDGGFQAEVGILTAPDELTWRLGDGFGSVAHVDATQSAGWLVRDGGTFFQQYTWQVPDAVPGRMYVFSCTVHVTLDADVPWARIEPFVAAGAHLAAEAGTEHWAGNFLPLAGGGIAIDSLSGVCDANPYTNAAWYGVELPYAVELGPPPVTTQFDAGSDVFTNGWLGLSLVGDGYTLAGAADFAGAHRTYALTGRQTVRGVDCLVLSVDGFGRDPVREYYDLCIAEDTSGSLRVLKRTGVDGGGQPVSWLVGSPDEAPVLMPAAPAEGQPLAWLPGEAAWIDATGEATPLLATGLGPYGGCAVRGWSDGRGHRYAWFAPGAGVVMEEWYDDDGGFGRWERSSLVESAIDWAGTWAVGGYSMQAGTSYTGAYSTQTPDGVVLTITRRDDGLWVVDPGDPDYAIVVEADGAELRGQKAGVHPNGDHYESFLRMRWIDQDAAIFLYAEGGYNDEGNWWGASFAGLAAREAFIACTRPFIGEYDVREFEVFVNGSPGQWQVAATESDLASRISYLGGGQYAVYDLDDLNAPAPILIPWGDRLLRNTAERLDDHNYIHWYETYYRGPDDSLYYLGHASDFESPMQRDLWWASFWVGVATPRPGFEWRADLTGDIDMSKVPQVALPGGSFKAPVKVSNRGSAPAAGKIDIHLYASADEKLGAGDVRVGSLDDQSLSLPGGQLRVCNVTVQMPEDLAYGDYYLLAVIDADDAIYELDETNNVVASGETFALAEPRRDLAGELGSITLPAALVPGDRGVVPVVVTNRGNIPVAGRIDIGVYLSADTQLDQGDLRVAALANQSLSLEPGAGRTCAARVTIPLDAAPGSYYILAHVDAANAVEEADEDNNVVATDEACDLSWRFGSFDGRRNVKLTVLDAANTQVAFLLTGGGWGQVLGGGTFDAVELHETTARSSFRIAPRGRERTTVGDIHADGSLRDLNAPAADLRGGVTITGLLGRLTLGDAIPAPGGHDVHVNAGLLNAARASVTMTFGAAFDVRLDTHGLAIRSLTALEWADTDGQADAITAPRIDSLRTKGRRARVGVEALPGDFQADLRLGEAGAAGAKPVLGSAVIAGEVGRTWQLAGSAGTIKAASADASWALSADGYVKTVDVKDALRGQLTAEYFTRISTKGELAADIVARAEQPPRDTSIGSLRAGAVTDVSLNVPAGIGSITVVDWTDPLGAADAIRAKWIGRLTTTGRRGNARLGIEPSNGNLQADLVLGSPELPPRKAALGSARIAGSLTGAAWDLDGDCGALTVRGDVDDWTAAARSVRSLTAGDVRKASLTVHDALGAVKVARWAEGTLDANTVRSLSVTGRRGAAAVPGDFAATLIIRAEGVSERSASLGSARIAGDLTSPLWDVAGNLGPLTVGGTARGATIRSTGDMARLTLGATEDCRFLAGIHRDVTDHARLVSDFTNAAATIKSIQVRGRRLPKDDPTRFVINTTFSAATILSVSLVNTNGGDACGLYALADDGREIRSVRYQDTLTDEWWVWRSGRGEPPIFGSLTLMAIDE